MHRSRHLRQFAFIALLLFLSIWIFDRATAWPRVGTDEQLLASVTSYPITWSTASTHVDIGSWGDDGLFTFFHIDSAVITDQRFFDSWSGNRWAIGVSHHSTSTAGPPYINQVMRQYTSPLEAMIKLRQIQPGDPLTWGNLHFAAPINTPALIPPFQGSPITAASERQIRCAVGPIETCEMWYAWLRYGQYILQINVITPQHGMDKSTFTDLVTKVDAHTSQALRQE
jgi:hypothetical protein